MFFVAIPEVGLAGSNLHYHLLVRLPSDLKKDFAGLAELMWKKFNPTGSLYVQRIAESPDDLKSVVEYDLKDIWKNDGYAQIIYSTELN